MPIIKPAFDSLRKLDPVKWFYMIVLDGDENLATNIISIVKKIKPISYQELKKIKAGPIDHTINTFVAWRAVYLDLRRINLRAKQIRLSLKLRYDSLERNRTAISFARNQQEQLHLFSLLDKLYGKKDKTPTIKTATEYNQDGGIKEIEQSHKKIDPIVSYFETYMDSILSQMEDVEKCRKSFVISLLISRRNALDLKHALDFETHGDFEPLERDLVI